MEFGPLWYNTIVKKIVITKVVIEYSDGTKEELQGNEIEYWSNAEYEKAGNKQYNKEQAIKIVRIILTLILGFFLLKTLQGFGIIICAIAQIIYAIIKKIKERKIRNEALKKLKI